MRRTDPALTAMRLRRRGLASVYRRRWAGAQAELERRHREQRARWKARATGFGDVLDRLGAHDDERLVDPEWRLFEAEIASYLRPEPEFGFLRSTTLRDTMVMVTGGKPFARELETCRTAWDPARLDALAEEDLAGDPVLHSAEPLTSHTRIHHLHTLARHRLACGPVLDDAAVVIEWGGGFGGMARLLRRLSPAATVIVIDLPVLAALQWTYLGVTLGAEHVHLVDSPGAGVTRGKVNLVPPGLLAEIGLEPDVFLSTWALGESQAAAQDECRERGWLDAPHLVIADQRTRAGGTSSDRLLRLAEANGAALEEVGTVPGSLYAFR